MAHRYKVTWLLFLFTWQPGTTQI